MTSLGNKLMLSLTLPTGASCTEGEWLEPFQEVEDQSFRKSRLPLFVRMEWFQQEEHAPRVEANCLASISFTQLAQFTPSTSLKQIICYFGLPSLIPYQRPALFKFHQSAFLPFRVEFLVSLKTNVPKSLLRRVLTGQASRTPARLNWSDYAIFTI